MQKLRPTNIFFVIILLAVFSLGAYAASTRLIGVFGEPHTLGSFSPNGNAGTVTLMTDAQSTTVGAPGVTLEGDGTSSKLVGNFFLQTVGWVELGVSGHDVTVTPPSGADANLLLPWAVSGYAWSPNAGWITLQSLSPLTYSGVYYIPGSGSLDGYAWSDTLGYIHFNSGGGASDAGLVARVKIIGNTAGASSFDSLYVANNGTMKTTSVLTPFINTVRKNVSILTRNAPDTLINKATTTQKSLGNVLYYKLESGGSVNLSTASTFCTAGDTPRSLIVEGGDIIVDRDVSGGSKSCAIIALSNGAIGGNIYITSTPKTISSYLISEGSVLAGANASSLYNDTKAKLTNLPQNQLYILGGIISRNTIGGAITDKVVKGACPYTEANCDRDVAIKYDLNFARAYTKKPANRAYTKDDKLENYSLIIEYDARSAGDPPPGMRNE